MKKIMVLLAFLCSFSGFSQTNDEIAGVYLKRARLAIEESIDFREAKVLFEKALKYIDSVKTADMAKLGARIYFEIGEYRTAKTLSKKYFQLYKKRKDERYDEQVELAVLINDELDKLVAEEKRLERERILKEKYSKYIDSLENVWVNRATELSFKADTIYAFNKNGVALFSKEGKFGALSDVGDVLVPADTYVDVISFSGYFIFKDKVDEPTQLYCYDTNVNKGFDIPELVDFNTLSTNYGEILLPRENGFLVTYPNNAYEPLVINLNSQEIVSFTADKDLFKKFRKADVIDNYNSDGEIKKEKTWYTFGGHLGGGVHPLYLPDYKLSAFLFSIDGTMKKFGADYDYLGPFHQNAMQAKKGDTTVWLNQNGTEVEAVQDNAKGYEGISIVKKRKDGNFQIFQNGIMVLGKQRLEKMQDFIRKFTDK